MGQMSETDFRENPQLHARALLQTAGSNADALTVGVGCSIEVGITRRANGLLRFCRVVASSPV
jgi:hypothetical protein